jgi:hypothetical protein
LEPLDLRIGVDRIGAPGIRHREVRIYRGEAKREDARAIAELQTGAELVGLVVVAAIGQVSANRALICVLQREDGRDVPRQGHAILALDIGDVERVLRVVFDGADRGRSPGELSA